MRMIVRIHSDPDNRKDKVREVSITIGTCGIISETVNNSLCSWAGGGISLTLEQVPFKVNAILSEPEAKALAAALNEMSGG